MKSTKRIEMIMGIAVFFVFLTASFASAEVLDKSDHWKSFAAIYGWVPAITGDVKVKGLQFDLDTTYADAVENLKFFFMGHYEGFKGHWGIMVDGMYAQLEKDKDHSGGALPGKRQFKRTSLWWNSPSLIG